MKYQTFELNLTAAATMNMGGVMVLYRVFTNWVPNEFEPIVMSNFG
jgi:hypothetical protein